MEETGNALRTFLPPPDDLDAFLEEARRHLDSLAGEGAVELEWRWQPQEDWESLWKRGLGVRRVTDRLVVAPSWEDVSPARGDLLITLDPGMAFGTAEHPTTRGCLRLLDGRVGRGDRIADVGAGSGILSIAAALLGAREVLALEMDELACQAARSNVEANDVGDRVRVCREEVGGRGPLPGEPRQGIVANLQRLLLLPLLTSFRESLAPGGWLIVSGILLREWDGMVRHATEAGFGLEEEDREGEWWSGGFTPLPSIPPGGPGR